MLCSAAQFINLNAIFHVKIALLKREFVQFTATAEKRRRASSQSAVCMEIGNLKLLGIFY